jgi:hypothetical protein
MKFGVIDKVFYDEYLSSQACASCGKDFDNKLIVYCKAFVTGPITWWAWKKQGYMECKNCGFSISAYAFPNELKKVRHTYSAKRLPFYFYLPTIVVSLCVLLFSLGAISKYVYNASTLPEQRLQGMWGNTEGSASLFLFDNNEYTLIEKGKLQFGTYTFDKQSGKFSINFNSEANVVDHVDGGDMHLNVASDENITFGKMLPPGHGLNPYKKQYNLWRIQATHSESNAELKQRVMDYLNYLKMRYEWALENNIQYIPADVISPILQAQNGIGVYETSLNNWITIFYSEAEWSLANQFLVRAFPKDHKINEQEPNVFKRNLEAINAYIENAKKLAI